MYREQRYKLPLRVVNARVVGKRVGINEHRKHGWWNNMYNRRTFMDRNKGTQILLHTLDAKTYHVTFELAFDDLYELYVPEAQFDAMKLGDRGVLKYQNSRFKSFEPGGFATNTNYRER